ncbi:PorT family protein [Flavobacterium sp. N502540]|uniref:PorT family protein n=1 Tax=Flavobacterium sp. N502540 TaxID=2986838 RepID=UPI00222428CD|nr:PorT family protein [Flavobacterium sp. N502540]
MKKQALFLVLTLIISINSYSQIVFEHGYIINQNDQKIECQIENQDWKNTPTSFRYQLPDNTNIITADIKTVKEFAITGQSKYIRSLVKIDRSSKNIENMSTDKNPDLKEETLFLKVLIEGKASLYLYDDGNLRRFFYKMDNTEIKQLIYKTYLVNENYSIAKNNYFREQLFIDLKCDNILQREYEILDYNYNKLLKFFIKYNKCSDTNFATFETKEKKDLFNLTIRPRLNSSSLSMNNSNFSTYDTKFDSKLNLSIGLEAEFIFPFNKNKWALIVEPTYQYYNSEKTNKTNNVLGGEVTAKVDYKSIELPIGIRHYFFLKNQSKIFVNASLLFDINSKSKIELVRKDGSELNNLDVGSRSTMALGVGGKFRDKYSIEFRYLFGRTILKDYLAYDSKFATVSLIVGYSFF